VKESIDTFSDDPSSTHIWKVSETKYERSWVIMTPQNGAGTKFEIRTKLSSAVDWIVRPMEIPKSCVQRRYVATYLPQAEDRGFWPTSEFGLHNSGQSTMRGVLIDMIDALRQKFDLQPLERVHRR
jgi:hypothetical protein